MNRALHSRLIRNTDARDDVIDEVDLDAFFIDAQEEGDEISDDELDALLVTSGLTGETYYLHR